MVEGVLWAGLCLLALTTAGPLDRFPRDVSEDYQSIDLSAYANFTANEVCFSDNEVFQKGDLMPNPGPCEECRCEPPSIVCQMVKCPVNNNGCRTIQRPNHCCPDYNCECDYNGQLYSDGERLDLPDQPCQVCYCKGGEVMCTSLTCYTRSDCEPQHVPGQCCPKYTNCPLRDMAATNNDDKSIQTRSTNKTAHSPKREMQPWLLTNSAVQTSGPPVTKRPEEVTNEDGLVIIVSDWLTERKTTPESSAQGQNLQDVTKLGESHILSTEKTELITRSDGFSTKKTHDIVSPPLDEVIFTRIDSLNNQEKNISSSTHFVSNLLEDLETTSVPTKTTLSNELIYENTESKNDWSTITPSSTTTNVIELYTQGKYLVYEENTTDQSSNRLDITKEESSAKPEFTTTQEIPLLDSQTPDMRVVEGINREESILKYDSKKSTQKPIKQEIEKETNFKVQVGSALVNDTSMTGNKTDKASIEKKDDMVSSNESDSKHIKGSKLISPISMLPLKTDVTDESKGQNDTEMSFTYNENDVPVTNSIESVTDEMYLTKNFQKDSQNEEQSPIDMKEENINYLSTGTQLPYEENHSMHDTTEIQLTDVVQTTTPYFTEDHMVGLEIEQNKSYSGSKAIEKLKIPSKQESSTDSITTNTESYEERKPDNDLSKLPFPSNNSTSNDFLKVAEEFGEMIKNSNKEYEKRNDSIVVLSSEEAQFDIQEVSASENHEESSEFPVTDIVNENRTNTVRGPTNIESISIEQSYKNNNDANDEIESTTLAKIKHDEAQERSASISNVPPVLELNSHVPFLLLGGSGNLDLSDSLEDTEVLTTSDQSQELTSTDHTVTIDNFDLSTNSIDENNLNDVNLVDKLSLQSSKTKNSDNSDLESTTISNKDVHLTVTSSHIPLTPGDLKVLAEYLIKEKIKPVEASKDATYSPNKWLQGNLTSEDKIASIMAAANVSVGIMNQTLKGVAVSINTKANNNEKKDKELSSKGHSFTDDVHKKVSNEKYIQDKYRSKDLSPSHNALPGVFLNDGLAIDGFTDPTQDMLTILPQELTTSKQAGNNIQLHNLRINASFDQSKIENNIESRNGTNDPFQNTSTLSNTLSDTSNLREHATEGPINTLNNKYMLNDSIISTIYDVNNNSSKNLHGHNLMDNLNKNTNISLAELSHYNVTKAPDNLQKGTLVP